MIQFTEDIILENERVLLRPIALRDVAHLMPFALNETDIWKFSLVSPAGGSGIKAYIQHAVNNRIIQKDYTFIVYDKLARSYAGSTRFYNIDAAAKSLMLGYTWYGKSYQRTGLNRNCKFLLLKHCFETLQAERVEFRADADNLKSKAAMLAIGCVQEGLLRSDSLKPDGTRRNSIVLSILKTEWENKVKDKLTQMISTPF